jgi:hypothetical protein
MNNDREDLAKRFDLLATDELLRRCESGSLTALAQEVALAELQRRGVMPRMAEPEPEAPAAEEEAYAGDMLLAARCLTPTEAHILQACLEAAGIPSVVTDDQLLQANAFLTAAVGGVRVLVPASCLAQAKEVIAAFHQGAYQLPDDTDVGSPEP